MPHISLQIEAIKYTTREGDHPDDKLYLDQLKDLIQTNLQHAGFFVRDGMKFIMEFRK